MGSLTKKVQFDKNVVLMSMCRSLRMAAEVIMDSPAALQVAILLLILLLIHLLILLKEAS